jgi:hypothetical protein
VAKKIRDLLTEDLQTVQGQVHNWIDRYFPEFLNVFKKWEGKAALQFLKLYAFPHEIAEFTRRRTARPFKTLGNSECRTKQDPGVKTGSK